MLPLLRRTEFWLGLAIVPVDQATKALVRARIGLHESIEMIPGLLNITHVLNTGAAFGLLNAADFPFKSVVIAPLAIGALVAIAFYAMTFGTETRLARYSMMLILAGATGNLIDRAVAGAVVDFIDVYWGSGTSGPSTSRTRPSRSARFCSCSTCSGPATCTLACLNLARSPSTATGCCWRWPICRACSSR